MGCIQILRNNEWKFPYIYSESIYAFLKKKYEKLIRIYRDFNAPEETVAASFSMCESILNTIDAYLSGEICKAHLTMYGALEKIKKPMDNISCHYQKNMSNVYYRARREKKGEVFQQKDLFHVPFEERFKVRNDRYSVAGIPALYLGATPYICWEELGRLRENEIWFSKVIPSNKYKYLALCVHPWEFKEDYFHHVLSEELLHDYLQFFPLIIACSCVKKYHINIKPSEIAFREDYIIPQIVSAWIKARGFYDGIIYSSVRAETYSKRNRRLYQNLFIPTKITADSGYCSVLSKEIKISAPLKFELGAFLQQYNSEGDKIPGCVSGFVSNPAIRYIESGFAKVEGLLLDYECEPIK